ncbi:cytochrome P450 4C1-like [Periplaneta americana]|uniref:cytochrome P450 4C1-like n=1 Tax=Periplaneta americana TaxID=6978 RepID=UPI0037E83276
MLSLIVALVLAIFLLLVILAIVFPYDYTWMFRKADSKKIEMIPGPKPMPLFGNILLFNVPAHQLLNVLLRLHKEYSSTFRIWVMGFPEVFITDPDDIEIILSSRSHITKSLDYNLLQPWLGTGLLTSSGDKWQSHRKILTPAFHFKILEEYVQVFNSNSRVLIQKLQENVGKPFVDISSYVTMCTLDIICETAMGITVNAQTGGQTDYIKAVKRMSELVVHRQTAPWLHRRSVFKLTPSGREQGRVLKKLHGFTEQVIKERRAEYRAGINRFSVVNNGSYENSGKRKHMTFLDLLIEVSEKEGLLSDTDIREEVDTFMFEGHDTTSAAISWALFTLGSHPEIQENVIRELGEIFGDSEREATYEDLQKMKYMEQVIKEALRLYPSVPGICRKLDVDVKLKNYMIPAGTSTPIIPYIIHRNPEIFPNPEEFNPDHFLPEVAQTRHPFAYIPFSAGPRNCIGQRFALLEEKAVLASVLRKFKIQSLDRRESIDLMLQLILRPKHGIRVKLTPR